MPQGTARFFWADKRYGFIAPDDRGKDVYVDRSELEKTGLLRLVPDQRVTFDVELDTKSRNPVARPNQAYCKSGQAFCTAEEYTALMFINYRIGDLDNLTFRTEYYNDLNGQRTGIKARYANFALGLQHWFSPSIVIRPEIASYETTDGTKAFGRGGLNTNPTQSQITIFAIDTIIHF
jgi:cold shock CspA family protein